MATVIRAAGLFVLIICSQCFGAEPPSTQTTLRDVDLDEAKLRVHFIDVGNGLAVLIETPRDRRHIFIDGGDEGLDDMEAYVAKFVGQKPVNLAVVTHADKDHYYGMNRILEKFEVRQFWNTGYSSEPIKKSTSLWQKFLKRARQEPDMEIFMPIEDWQEAGDVETVDDGGTPASKADDVTVRFLNVDRKPLKKDPISGRKFTESQQRNNASLVFKLAYKDVSFLITGDINGRDKESEGADYDDEIDSEEAELLKRHRESATKFGLRATVLQAPHHGSNGSCSLPFLKAVKPEWVVIPAGSKGHNHPSSDTLRRMKLADIEEKRTLRTDHGDPLKERKSHPDALGDDSFIFETDGATITRVLWVKME